MPDRSERHALLRLKSSADENGCWIFTGGLDPKGYGRLYWDGHDSKAHRVAYTLAKGPIPDGYHVHHTCRVRACINPDHLEALEHSAHILEHAQGEWSTLTWDDVRAIRAANKAGVGIYELAERYSLSIGTLHPLILNRTWIDPDYLPGVEKTCDECSEAYVTTKVNKRFCSRPCRMKWNSRTGGRQRRGQAADGSETRSYRRAA